MSSDTVSLGPIGDRLLIVLTVCTLQATDAALTIRVLAPTRFCAKDEGQDEHHPLDQLFCCIEEDDARLHDVKILVNTVQFIPDLMKSVPFMHKLFPSCYNTKPHEPWALATRFTKHFDFYPHTAPEDVATLFGKAASLRLLTAREATSVKHAVEMRRPISKRSHCAWLLFFLVSFFKLTQY